MINKIIVAILVLTLHTGLVIAHAGPSNSVEPIVVRAISYTPAEREYTFNCSIPVTASESRHWTVRYQGTLVHEETSTSPTLTQTLSEDKLYHIGCEVANGTPAVYIQSDFHIDRTTGPNTDKPNIVVSNTDETDFDAYCDHPTATNYNLHWYLFHPITGQNIELSEFSNQNNISTNVSVPGLWDLGCGIWDIDANQWSQWGIPIEFFPEGQAYIPNVDGCLPDGTCPFINTTNPANATLTVTKIVINDNNGTLNISDFPLFVSGTPVTSGAPQEFTPGMYEVAESTNANYTASFSGDCLPDGTITLLSNETKSCTITNDDIDPSINQPPLAPTWLEPSENKSDVDVVDFHIQVFPMIDPEGDEHIATDFEMWDVALNERIWSALYSTEILNHIHNANGIFENSLAGEDRLEYDTAYRLRARFYSDSADNNVSEWSEWRNFRTDEQLTFNNSPFDWTAREGYTVELVTKNVSVPVNVVVAPDLYTHLPEDQRPLLYVTQLYGQIGVILRDGTYQVYADDLLNYETFGSLPGSGEAGVTGLYVDPITGDIYVSMVYNDPISGFLGKVDKYTTNSDGDSFTANTTIIEDIPTAPSHQVHTITRGPDGKLYLHTGDDDQPFNSQNISVLSGKILRMNDDGSMPPDNPFPGTYVYAAGFRNPFGGAWRPGTSEYYVSNNGPDSHDGVYQMTGGETFGWCCDTEVGAWHTWIQTVAPTQLVFDPLTSNFSDMEEHDGTIADSTFYVALSGPTYSPGPALTSKRIVQFRLDENGTKLSSEDLVTYTGEGLGAPIGVAVDDDVLYFTDIYGEIGFVGVGLTRGNIFRVVRGNQTANETNETNASFSADIGTAAWYPQGLNVIWECKPTSGSGSFSYDYFFGDGQKQLNSPSDNVWHTYPANGTYNVSCTIHDLVSLEDASAQTSIVLGTSGPSGTFCGDGTMQSPNSAGTGGPLNDGFEDCDGTDGVPSGFFCEANCTLVPASCGDGVVNQASEECDGTDGVGAHQSCLANCTLIDLTYCGDSIKQSPNDEGIGGPLNDGFEDCDGSDGVGVNQSCTVECIITSVGGTSVELSIAQWFPQGLNAVLICTADGFTPTSYDWFFGDGHKQLGTSNPDVWHTYAAAGTYEASCIATNGVVTESDMLNVTV